MKLAITVSLVASALFHTCAAFAPVSTLLQDNAAKISKLREIAAQYPDAPTDSIFYLRYCLSEKDDKVLALKVKNYS